MKEAKFKELVKPLQENYQKKDLVDFMVDSLRIVVCSDEFKDYDKNAKQIHLFMFKDTFNLINGLDI